MGQKTDSLERDKTTSTADFGTTSQDPPSWSELSSKADADQLTKNTMAIGGVALAFGLVLPIGALVSVFVASIAGSAFGLGGPKSGAIAGGAVGGFFAFFGSILLSILSMGLLTVFPTMIIGAIVGGLGGFIGQSIRE